jgi:hypothetical protein
VILLLFHSSGSTTGASRFRAPSRPVSRSGKPQELNLISRDLQAGSLDIFLAREKEGPRSRATGLVIFLLGRRAGGAMLPPPDLHTLSGFDRRPQSYLVGLSTYRETSGNR